MKTTLLLPALALPLLALPALSLAQASFTGTYGENFNSLDNLGTLANGGRSVWRDDETLDGWYTNIAPTATLNGVPINEKLYYIFNDPPNNDKIYALGSVGRGLLESDTNDRALSFNQTSQFTSRGPLYVGLRLRNDTGAAIGAIDLDYFGELWGRPDAANANQTSRPVTVGYRVGGTALLGDDYTSGPGLGFVNTPGPVVGSGLNGNLPENRIASGGRISGLSWGVGEDLWLRFENPYTGNGSANSYGLAALDDLRVAVAPVPEPATLAALGLGAVALLRRRRR